MLHFKFKFMWVDSLEVFPNSSPSFKVLKSSVELNIPRIIDFGASLF